MGRLDGRVAIVTGSGQGIGRGVARRFAAEGAAVAVAERNPETGARVAAEIVDDLGGQAAFVPTDVLDAGQLRAMVDRTVSTFGHVDILVNNAYAAAAPARFERKPDRDLEFGFQGGPLHTYRAMQAVFPHFRAQRWGRIINLVSLNGINAHMYSVDYNAAKEAVRAITRTAAREWARHNILVNAIAPGPIVPPPDMSREEVDDVARATPVGHWGGEAEIAKAVVLLCQTDFITGETIRVDGGRHLE